jgi:O-antigen/teichoic acid export membrane protein
LTTGPHSSGESLTRKVVKGSVWLFSSYALSKLARLVMMLIIAAMLSPREYGIISLTVAIFTLVQIVNEFGFDSALIQRSNPDERFLNTAFTANLFSGLVLAIGVFLVAPWIAHFYREPDMASMLRVAGLALMADATFYVPDGLLRKELSFKSRALPEVAGTFVAVVITIALLLLGTGVLSYAVGLVLESVTRSVLTVRQVSWRPKLQISLLYLREIISYAKYIFGEGMGKYLANNVDYFIVGRVLGAGPLGFYTLAFSLANYPIANFTTILSRIAFPTFASLQADPEYAKRVYLKLVRIITALVVPALVMLALLATPLVVGLLGEKWQPSVFPLQLMVVAGISKAVSIPSSDILRGFGSASIPFRVSILQGLVMTGALILVASRGIETVALTVAVILSLASWTITIITCRTFGIGLRELGWSLVPAVALTLSGVGAVLLLRLLDLRFLPDTLSLAASVGAAGAAMAVCLVTVCRGFLSEVLVFLAPGKLK